MTVAEAFAELMARLELDESYQRVVEDRHAAVRKYLERQIPGARTQLIGSLQRRTRIDPVDGLKSFDVDVLVELGNFTHWVVAPGGVSCDSALDQVEGTIRGNLFYRRMGIETDRPAIVVPYSDGSYVEVVPGYRNHVQGSPGYGRSYWVPRTGGWRAADYDFDAGWISLTNEMGRGRIIPTIKMLKAWRREHCSDLRSYHLEILTAHAALPLVAYAQQASRNLPWQVLIAGTLAKISESVQVDASIPGSASELADSYLTQSTRNRIAAALRASAELASLANTIESKSSSESLAIWRGIFGHPFPA